jgi:hypothetical protein
MATNKNFEVKNGLSVGGTERISSAGEFSGSLASGVTATTQSAADSSTKIATTAYTDAAITALIGGAPSALNDLNELAAAIADDANYSTTLTTALATKLPLAGGTLTGNLGIGATPEAYHSDYKAIDINNSASVMGYTGNNGAWLLENLYYGTDGNWKHKNSDFSAAFEMYDGVFNLYNTASGTADATATLQNRLKIDATGNVGIGTSSMSSSYGKLTVAGTGISITPDTSAKMQIGRYNAANPYSYIKAGSTSSGFKFTNSADSLDIFTITNTGDIGIGTADPSGSPAGTFTWPNGLVAIAGTRPALYLNGSSSYTTLRMWPSGTDGASTTVDDWHVNTVAGGTSTGRLSFQPQGGALSAAGLSLKPDGKVGIGTFTPDANLHVFNNTNTANNVGSLGFDVSASIGNNATNPGNHYSSGIRIFQGSGSIGSGLGVFNIGVDNGTATATNQYTAHLIAPTGMTGGITLNNDGLEIARIKKHNSSCNILIGATEPTHTRSDDATRNKLYVQGTYPVISIIGGNNGNVNHGPTLQFGNQTSGNEHWVIGSGNTTAQLDFGWGDTSDRNPHHGIAGYGASGGSGQTKMRITSAGVGVGGNWGTYGTVVNPAYPLHVQGTASATQYNRGAIEMGTIIEYNHTLAATNHSLSGSTTAWTATGLTKTVTPQSANSYFWVEIYHNEHINPNTPNYGGGLRLMGGTTEISRGGEMEYQAGTWASGSDYRYNGNSKTWGGWYNPQTASAITFTAQVAAPNGQAGNYYYWHWQSNYIANMTGPRLRIIEFT